MTEDILRAYRLKSTEEPTDEQLHAIMEGVAEEARLSTARARQELDRRFDEMAREIKSRLRKETTR